MRKTKIALSGLLVIALSVAITVYIVQHPLRPESPDKIRVGVEETSTLLSPRDLLKKGESNPLESQDGSETSTATALDDGLGGQATLYPRLKSGQARVVAAQPVSDSGDFIAPRWSPVGLDIAFTRPDRDSILITGSEAAAVQTLSNDPNVGAEFTWNIDGMSLHARQPDGQAIELMITGEKYPAPRGEQKVFVRDDIIYYESEDEQITRISGPEDRFHLPTLSPDESRVVFLGRETGIYIASVDGSSVANLGRGENVSWLPDSSGIVFDLPVNDGTTVVDGDLWMIELASNERSNLTRTPGIVESYPAVSPDGERIAFSSAGRIYVGKLARGRK